MSRTPIEQTIKYATTVDTLLEAWEFVMDHLGNVGDSPNIQITPAWYVNDDGSLSKTHFDVSVSGMVEVK